MVITILKIAASAATILTGLLALVKPANLEGFTGLKPVGGRGITEIRTSVGAVFIALGAAAIFLSQPAAFSMLGIMYLLMAAVRGVFMIVDQSVESSNTISLLSEIVLGVILVL